MTKTLSRTALAAALFALLFVPVSAADAYKVDGGHSTVMFKVNHLGFSHTYGRFNEIDGSALIDEANASGSSISLSLDAGSVDTGNPPRDEHIRKADFLNAKEFPTITFKSKSVKKKGKVYEVAGELTLRGVTKSITVPMTRLETGNDPWGNERTGFDGSFTIERADYGVNYMPEGIGADVTMILSIELIKEKGE